MWWPSEADPAASDRDPVRRLRSLSPGARADLLRALTSPPDVRAERIHLCFERPDTRDLGEMLIDLEEDGFVRAAVVEALRAMGTPIR